MPFIKPEHQSYRNLAQSEISLNTQRAIWRNQRDFWGEVIPAAFTLENTVGAVRQRMKFPLSGSPPNPDFDAFDPQRNRGTVFELYPELLRDVGNLEDWEIMRQRAEAEQENLRIVNSSPNAFGAMLIAGLIDPINLLPVGFAAPAASRALLKTSMTQLTRKTMVRGSVAGFTGNLQAEALLQASRDFRTPEETGINLAAGALLGSMIGAASIPWAIRNRMKSEIYSSLGEEAERMNQLTPQGEPTVHVLREDRRAKPTDARIEDRIEAISREIKEQTAALPEGKIITQEIADLIDEQARLINQQTRLRQGSEAVGEIEDALTPEKVVDQMSAEELEAFAKLTPEEQATELARIIGENDSLTVTRNVEGPVSIMDLEASKEGSIVNPERPIKALDDADAAEYGLDQWHWIENTRTTHGEKAHTTTLIPWSQLRNLLPASGRGKMDPPPAGSKFQLRRPRLWVIVENRGAVTKNVAAEMRIIAFNEADSLGHLEAVANGAVDPRVPVEIVVIRPTKAQKKQIAAGQFDPADIRYGIKGRKVGRAISLGRLRAHADSTEPGNFRLTRSITCASPCAMKSNEDILDEGKFVPGGYQTDGKIGISKEAQEFDTTGAYNPHVNATEQEMKSALGLEKLIGMMFPSVRIAMSNLKEIRQIGPKLLDMQILMENMNPVQGNVTVARQRSAELGIKMWNRHLGELIEAQDRAWIAHRMEIAGKKYKKDGSLSRQIGVLDARDMLKGAPEGGFTKHQFFEEIGRAMRRQLDGEVGSDNPHVEFAAKETRKRWDALFSAAEEVGLIDPIIKTDPKTGEATTRIFGASEQEIAQSYFKRVYKKRLLKDPAEHARFIIAVSDSFEARFDMTPEAAVRAADMVYDHIMTTPRGRTPSIDIPGFNEIFDKPEMFLNRKPSATRPRTFDIHDFVIERWLEDDAQMISRFMFRTMVPDIEIARNFGAYDPKTGRWKGDPNMTAALSHAADEIRTQVKIRTDRGDRVESIVAFQKRAEKDLKDLAHMRDILRGQYAVPNNPEHGVYQFLQSIRMINYLTMGGGFMLSSIPDVARLVTVNGMANTFGTALRMFTVPKNIKQSLLREARLSGTAWETLLNQRAANVFDLADDFGTANRIQMGLRSTADRFSTISLLSPWNDVMKRWAGIYSGQNMANHVEDYVARRATPRQLEQLNFWGFNHEVIQGIWHQIKGKRGDNGIYFLDTPNWRNAKAKDAFRLALVSEIDRTIITPGAGDVPKFLNTEVGRTIFQFKRFAIAATKTIALSNVQWRDAQALNGALLGVGMGIMVAKAKSEQYGYPIKNDFELLLAGVDRSGVLGIFPDINQSIGLATGGTIAPGHMVFGGRNRDMFSNRDWSDVLLGPTRGTARNIMKGAKAIGKTAMGQWDQVLPSEMTALARVSGPYTLFYLTRLYKEAIDGLSKPGMRARRQQRKEQKAADQAAVPMSKLESERLLQQGEYTYLEMAWEDGGTDNLVDIANERHDYHHDSKPITLLEQHHLRSKFNGRHMNRLKKANEANGITGMVDYLRFVAEETK